MAERSVMPMSTASRVGVLPLPVPSLGAWICLARNCNLTRVSALWSCLQGVCNTTLCPPYLHCIIEVQLWSRSSMQTKLTTFSVLSLPRKEVILPSPPMARGNLSRLLVVPARGRPISLWGSLQSMACFVLDLKMFDTFQLVLASLLRSSLVEA